MDKHYLLKAQSPAALAEEYILKSIWSHKFPAGSDLPAERELADKIGVTRTTLREVLQRLSREGWITIQHGKPTKVNDIWESAGPSIIKTIIRLDKSYLPTIVSNVISLRTRMAEFYIPEAIKHNAKACAELFSNFDNLKDNTLSYIEFDYHLFRQFTFIANKPVYALILNSFKDMYYQVAHIFFEDAQYRKLTHKFYQQLYQACVEENAELAYTFMNEHHQSSHDLWNTLFQKISTRFG